MISRPITLILILVIVIISQGCISSPMVREGTKSGEGIRYSTELKLEHPIEFRPRRFSSGDSSDHPCIRGDYYHVYDTDSGLHGREVWLCCVPIDEILSDSFDCAPSIYPPYLGDSDYTKIRYCVLEHPTATEPTYIPVCLPAPLEAPGFDQ